RGARIPTREDELVTPLKQLRRRRPGVEPVRSRVEAPLCTLSQPSRPAGDAGRERLVRPGEPKTQLQVAQQALAVEHNSTDAAGARRKIIQVGQRRRWQRQAT